MKNNHTVSIYEVLSYGYCPMLYKHLYVDNILRKNITLDNEYNDAIKKSIYGYLIASLDGNPNFSHIKSSWGRIWIKDKKTIEYLYSNPSSWRDTHNEKRKLGISCLKSFYDFYNDKPFYPVFMNKEYSINIGSVKLIGTFDVVLEYNDKIYILCFKTSDKNFNSININKDLEITAMSYAFKKLFGTKENEIIIFNTNKGNYTYTKRNNKDYELFEESILNIYKSIYNNIFYISPNQKCNKCSCKNICMK